MTVRAEDRETFFVGDVEIRPAEYSAFVAGQRVTLSLREFQMLLCLASRADRVVTREEIYDRVWGGTMSRRDRSVDVFVRKVRRRLAAVDPNSIYIHTHFGIGYRFAPEPLPDIDPSADA
jgi:DNA-binding response OmpR family regulator